MEMAKAMRVFEEEEEECTNLPDKSLGVLYGLHSTVHIYMNFLCIFYVFSRTKPW